MPATPVPARRPIPDDVKPSAKIRREFKAMWFELGAFVRQVDNEHSGPGTFRWLPSSQGNAAFPEQQLKCNKRTAVPEACRCPLFTGCGKHFEAQSEWLRAPVAARRLKLKTRAIMMPACFLITGINDSDYTIVFWYSIVVTWICQADFLTAFLSPERIFTKVLIIYILNRYKTDRMPQAVRRTSSHLKNSR